MAEDTANRRRGPGRPFKPGQSGNPLGRPKGARNRLGEAFLNDLRDVWESEGRKILENALQEEPMQFANMVARILPQSVIVGMFGDSSDGLKKFVVNLVGGYVEDVVEAQPELAGQLIEHEPPEALPEALPVPPEPVEEPPANGRRRYSRR